MFVFSFDHQGFLLGTKNQFQFLACKKVYSIWAYKGFKKHVCKTE